MDHDAQTAAAHGFRWLTVPSFADAISLLDLDVVRHVQRLGPDELVKDNRVRTVARLPDPTEPARRRLYVKRYKFPKRLARLRHLAVRTQPEVELRVCRALQRAGIPTCDVLAVAVRRRRGLPVEGFLVSREIPRVEPLGDYLRRVTSAPEAAGTADLSELAVELAALTARLIGAGFYHHDYHAGNLLIDPTAPPGERLFVVDLHSVRLRRSGRRGVLRMLAMLSLSAGGAGVPMALHEEFLRAFLAARAGGQDPTAGELAAWRAMASRARRRLHHAHMRSRTRRCMLESTLFTRDTAGDFVVRRRRDFPLRAAIEAIELHEAAMTGESNGMTTMRRGVRTEVSLCPCDTVPPLTSGRPARPQDLRPGTVCVKAFKRRRLRERAKDMLRPRGRARAAWIAARGLHVRGIPAARPLALAESRCKLGGRSDYLITEAVDADAELHNLVRHDLPSPRLRRRLGHAISALFLQMAEERAYHPDTKPGNILVKRQGDDYRLWLVDLDRVRFGRTWDRATWARSLARLNSSLPAQVTVLDRLRCLRACGHGRWTPKERLALARDVYALSLQRRPAWLDGSYGSRPLL